MAISTLPLSPCALHLLFCECSKYTVPFAFGLLYFSALPLKAFLVFKMQTRNYSNTVWFAANLYGFIISHQDLIGRFVKAGAHYAFISKPKET